MKQLVEDLKTIIDKYNKENNCAIEEIKVNTQTAQRPPDKRKIMVYNLTVVVNSL